jgi:alkaline phosphatase D
MHRVTRRQFVATAAALGATAVWAGTKHKRSAPTPSHERRDLFPEGVASGDPHPDSVLLWTRRPFDSGTQSHLRVEIAADVSR